MLASLLKSIIVLLAFLAFFYFASLAIQGKLEMKVVLNDWAVLSIHIQSFIQTHR